jgi:hypothetical protein
MADALRADKLRVPIAGVSHWRREPEFSAAQASDGLDLIDDRLYWLPPPWCAPERRSLLWSEDGGLAAGAIRKRKLDRPYAVGQWCEQTYGAWALAYEGAGLLLASQIAAADDWDALVRRGIFVHPEVWGADAAGTGGGEDIYQIPEVLNGNPAIFALWPHAASLFLRVPKAQDAKAPGAQGLPQRQRNAVAGWEPANGRLAIDTSYTQGLAGWPGGLAAESSSLALETDNSYAVVVASSMTSRPLSSTSRILVTALARVQPSGFRWQDEWKRDVADPGQAPLLQEPVKGRVVWRRKGAVQAYILDNGGKRLGPAKVEKADGGTALVLDGSGSAMHWELIVN